MFAILLFSSLFNWMSANCCSALDRYPRILDWQFLNMNSSLVLAFVERSWNHSGSSHLEDKLVLSTNNNCIAATVLSEPKLFTLDTFRIIHQIVLHVTPFGLKIFLHHVQNFMIHSLGVSAPSANKSKNLYRVPTTRELPKIPNYLRRDNTSSNIFSAECCLIAFWFCWSLEWLSREECDKGWYYIKRITCILYRIGSWHSLIILVVYITFTDYPFTGFFVTLCSLKTQVDCC